MDDIVGLRLSSATTCCWSNPLTSHESIVVANCRLAIARAGVARHPDGAHPASGLGDGALAGGIAGGTATGGAVAREPANLARGTGATGEGRLAAEFTGQAATTGGAHPQTGRQTQNTKIYLPVIASRHGRSAADGLVLDQ